MVDLTFLKEMKCLTRPLFCCLPYLGVGNFPVTTLLHPMQLHAARARFMHAFAGSCRLTVRLKCCASSTATAPTALLRHKKRPPTRQAQHENQVECSR